MCLSPIRGRLPQCIKGSQIQKLILNWKNLEGGIQKAEKELLDVCHLMLYDSARCGSNQATGRKIWVRTRTGARGFSLFQNVQTGSGANPASYSLGRSKGKGKVHPRTGHEGPEREQKYSCTLSLISVLDGVGCQRHAPAALPRERPDTHCIGGWMGLRSGLEGCGKSRPSPGFDPRTVQPVAGYYTD